jgi:hypothetical protein
VTCEVDQPGVCGLQAETGTGLRAAETLRSLPQCAVAPPQLASSHPDNYVIEPPGAAWPAVIA